MLGAGIYVLVGEVIGAAGMGAPMALVAAAMVAALTKFNYCELAARIFYGIGAKGWLPRALGAIDPRTRTPILRLCLAAPSIARRFRLR